jgi:hypothetical protein
MTVGSAPGSTLRPVSRSGRCPGEMRGEECTCLFFRILGGRFVVFDRVAKSAAAGLQNGNIEGMVGVRVDVQRNRRAVGPRMGNHVATAFRRGPVILFAGENQGRGCQRHQWKKAGRVIGDRCLKALGKILRRHIAIDGVKRRNAAIDWPRTAIRAASTNSC